MLFVYVIVWYRTLQIYHAEDLVLLVFSPKLDLCRALIIQQLDAQICKQRNIWELEFCLTMPVSVVAQLQALKE